LVIFDNFKSLYDWCMETGLSDLYDFICSYYIAHVVTHEDEMNKKARYVTDAMVRGELVIRLYIAPYNTV